ncbi:9015_t:CDS:2 [Scutellospora calospora]|uniref:9015_t:CDS:1 n=1 Tax=Scutellospora calospora TaxID=85575 RepID=A0ACA9KC41_9GLOM|nr:9015_t:CDS:2 [Scutellospora calospora]
MQLECIELLDALTEEQIMEAYKMIDETIRNFNINNSQGLEHFVEILIDVGFNYNLHNNKKEEEITYLLSYIRLALLVEKKALPPKEANDNDNDDADPSKVDNNFDNKIIKLKLSKLQRITTTEPHCLEIFQTEVDA